MRWSDLRPGDMFTSLYARKYGYFVISVEIDAAEVRTFTLMYMWGDTGIHRMLLTKGSCTCCDGNYECICAVG